MWLFLQHCMAYPVLPLFFTIPIVLLLAKCLSATTTQRDRLPSPPRLPVIGNLHQLGFFPHRALRSLAGKYGKLMLLHFGSVPVLVVSSADAAREIFRTHDRFSSSRPQPSIARRILYGGKDMAFVPYGDYWRQIRGITVLQLLSNRRVQSFRRLRVEEVGLMMEKLKASCSSSSPVPVNLSELLISLSNDVVCRVALGRKYGGDEGANKLMEVIGEFMKLMGVFNVADYIPWLAWVNRINGLDARVEWVAKELDRLMEIVVEEHMNRQSAEAASGSATTHSADGEDRRDFVDVLLAIQRDNSTGYAIERDSLKALILDMFIAGTDTTYMTLEWTMAELIKHPKVMKKLQNEVRALTKGQRDITEDDMEKLPYLKAVTKESLRLHLPAPLLVPRETIQDINLMGYKIASGTQIIVNAWAIQRDPALWEEAEEFRPERFLDSSIDFKGHHFELIPFGAGRRNCPGLLFATSLYELALANLVNKFDFSLPGGVRCEDIDMTETPGVGVHKKYPLQVIASPYVFAG